ncbi:MAG: thiol-disulfide oxidoreductase DCC family protein [Rhodothermaceae bacterium]|nr:thiol-disulfide oxidoreductase DCC family protein [Rhodothermaceae bacterium]
MSDLTHPAKHPPEHPVIFFDGVCNLCNAAVNFIIDRDKNRMFRFAALQSETGSAFLRRHNMDENSYDTFILDEGDTCYTRSDAALRITRQLDGAWPLLYGFIIIPRFLRDAVYRYIAGNRYRWFGRSEQCRVPTPELKELFLP